MKSLTTCPPILASLLALMVLGCASGPERKAVDEASSAQRAQVGEICKAVIRARPNETYYSNCVSSLVETVAQIRREQALGLARSRCMAQSLAAYGGNVALCEVNTLDSARDSIASASPALTMPSLEGHTDRIAMAAYVGASSSERLRRQRVSCALLGLEPIGGAFGQCVAQLSASMSQDEHGD